MLSSAEASKLHKATLSTLCIQRGEKAVLAEEGGVRKYTLDAQRLAMTIHTYVNRTEKYFNMAEKVDVPSCKCSKLLEDGDKLILTLPPNSLKLVTYRYSQTSSGSSKVRILESICQVKE